ncbi:hypothetical protein DPSP01_004798 [Paraphaeosphaeria sporulosa]|uniref:Cellular morphogenesis protein n=1 Tax=Paraphaeosphaeria sporulosa TaxID=1460663 RepID=A0A177CPY7_9PLEO|nr:uncharacterized protein CC84DRAFT_599807 [Paraphaeosphaeria sporulosa]OAG09002.1 hypothetical protein CC84DRAFT_599807 [Paraphaeosphaeria sporulosa]
MRDSFSSLLASRAGKLALSLLLASPDLISHTTAFTFNPVPAPNIDIARLGRVALAGDFDAISLYQYEGQNQDAATNGLYSRFPNGLFAKIQKTDGEVRAMCHYKGGNADAIVVGGNFTSVDGQSTPGGIALIDTNTGDVTATTGLTGQVNALLCDDERQQVYVGGSIDGGANYSNAIIWKADNSWSVLPFKGFDGIVHSIVDGPNDTVIFGGQFQNLKGVNLTGNGTAENNTQSLPIGSATITAQTSSGLQGFTDPKVIVCKNDTRTQGSDSTWLLADNSPGFWKADFGFGFQPTQLQLHNTDFEGRGTKEFRFTALPDGGIMNLTYNDPSSGERKFCDARCPLPQGNTSAQVFDFVNVVGMNSFRIDISDWYGNGGGLNGIELFQTEIYAYAIQEFNAPKCGGATSGGQATAVGEWQSTPSHDSTSKYLTATLDTANYSPNSTYVVFRPDVPQSGNYTIKMYTPGCQGDGTCGTRGRVNITGFMETGARPSSTVIAQTNDFDKYDEIYNGHVDVTNGFRPEVTLAPVAGQNPGTNVLTVVAQRVRFEIRTAQDNGTELNGLFEYNPKEQITSTNFTASTIDKAGSSLNPQSTAIVNALVTQGRRLYVGGNFTNGDGLNYIFAVDDGGPTALSGKGLNDQVVTIYPGGSTLYVGGNFTNTQDNSNGNLGRVAAYSDDKWQALGAGVDGIVTSIVPISNVTGNATEDVLAITGDFDNVRAFGNNPSFAADGFAIWVPSQNNWLQNLDLSTMAISGSITAFVGLNETDRFYAGQISSQGLGASGAAILNSNSTLSSLGIDINLQPKQQASLRKRALTAGQNVNNTGISTALFHKNGNTIDKTILAGHFAATDKDGKNITNVVIIDSNNEITGFGDEVDSNSTFRALGLLGDVLFAGGMVTGQVGNDPVAGVVAYDLASKKFQDSQPPALQGTNVTVNVIAARRNSQDVYVGGQFDSAGALSCPALCVWDNGSKQWNTPGADISGVVTNLLWVSDTKALVAGNLTLGSNNRTKIFTYDSTNSQFQEVLGAGDLPGTVETLCPANVDGSQMWAAGKSSDGKTYLRRFDGSKWVAVDDKLLGSGTNIQGLQALPLTQDHQKSDLIDQNQDLLILGQVNITGFGVASAALFNGTTLTPFLLASANGGASGSLSKVVAEHEDFFQGGGKHLALGFIVLIALAIALALTFLLVVAGILIEWYRKRAAGYSPAPTSFTDRVGNQSRIPPQELFGTLRGPQAPTV